MNKYHDHLKAAPIGFTAAAGNFEGKDAVSTQPDDGANTANGLPDGNHVDNANMSTPADGQSPTMQMYLFHQPGAKYPSEDPFIASNGGDDKPPAWLHNLKAQPRVEVQVAGDRRPATARVLERGDPDFERLWRLVNDNNSDRYDGYQANTQRRIPVVVLSSG